MNDYVPLDVVKGTILFCSGECWVVLDWSQTPDLRFVFLKTSLMESLSGVKCSIGLKVWSGLGERIES